MSETLEAPTNLMMHQIELEKLFSKNQLIPRIRAEFQNCEAMNFSDYLLEKEIPIPFGMDLLTQMALHKRATLPTLVGLLYHHFNDAQVTTDMIAKATMADLVDWSPSLALFIVKFTISADVQEELDRFQYPLPMVVEPKPLRTNRDTGYFLGSGSVILRNNHHEDDVCLDHLNRMNTIKLTINQDVVRMVKNSWKSLDKSKEGETKDEFDRRRKAFAKYDRTSKDVITLLMKENDHFHLTHKYDKRGRTYACGYHINTQGNPWSKAIVEFAHKELIQ